MATIVAIKGNQATVQALVKSSCSGCSQLDTCGSGQVAKAFPQRQLSFTTETDLKVHLGDTVTIAIPEKQLLATAWQVYLWPLLGLILGSAVGQWLMLTGIFASEFFAIILGGGGGYTGFYFARARQKSKKSEACLQPKILNIVSEKSSVRQIKPIS